MKFERVIQKSTSAFCERNGRVGPPRHYRGHLLNPLFVGKHVCSQPMPTLSPVQLNYAQIDRPANTLPNIGTFPFVPNYIRNDFIVWFVFVNIEAIDTQESIVPLCRRRYLWVTEHNIRPTENKCSFDSECIATTIAAYNKKILLNVLYQYQFITLKQDREMTMRFSTSGRWSWKVLENKHTLVILYRFIECNQRS